VAVEKKDDVALPDSEEALRGHQPEELREIAEALEARVRRTIQTDEGELRDLSDEEQAGVDLMLKIRAAAIKRIERHNSIMKTLRDKPAAIESPYMNLKKSLGVDVRDVGRMPRGEVRDAALRLLDSKVAAGHLREDQLVQVSSTIRKSTDIARRVVVTENEDYRNAWMKGVTQPTPLWTDDERDAMLAFEEYRAMSEGTSAAGGYGIPVFIDPSIILTAQGSGNPFLDENLVTVAEVNTNAWKGVSSAGVSWTFQAEGATAGDASPTLAQPTVTVFMARGFIPYSIEVGMDYPTFADQMQRLLAEGYSELLVQKFAVGSGTNEPMGLVTALDADTNDEVRLTTAGAFGEVDVYNVWKALPQRFRRGASWMMSVGANNAVRRFGTANVFHATTVNLPAPWADFLMGKSTYENPYMADVVNTTGSFNQLVVGDFKNYLVARRGGMNVELIPALFDITNNRPTGQRGWFAWARVGGGSINNQGFRLLNQT